MNNKPPLVSIIMGSDSDLTVMKDAANILATFGVNYELNIVSAHRTPQRMFDFAKNAYARGVRVIIAGGAAHLPGMTASLTGLPVIGVPIKSSNSIEGWDSILSILQMPNGIPVATVALNAARNAGLLAIRILSTSDQNLYEAMMAYQNEMEKSVIEKANKLSQKPSSTN